MAIRHAGTLLTLEGIRDGTVMGAFTVKMPAALLVDDSRRQVEVADSVLLTADKL